MQQWRAAWPRHEHKHKKTTRNTKWSHQLGPVRSDVWIRLDPACSRHHSPTRRCYTSADLLCTEALRDKWRRGCFLLLVIQILFSPVFMTWELVENNVCSEHLSLYLFQLFVFHTNIFYMSPEISRLCSMKNSFLLSFTNQNVVSFSWFHFHLNNKVSFHNLFFSQ